MRYHLTLVRMTIIKNLHRHTHLQITNAGENVEKRNAFYTVGARCSQMHTQSPVFCCLRIIFDPY